MTSCGLILFLASALSIWHFYKIVFHSSNTCQLLETQNYGMCTNFGKKAAINASLHGIIPSIKQIICQVILSFQPLHIFHNGMLFLSWQISLHQNIAWWSRIWWLQPIQLGLRTVRIMGMAISITGQTGCPHRQLYRFYLTNNAKRDGTGLKWVPMAINGHCRM